MVRYQIIADMDMNTTNLETAHTEAERLISAGARALGRPMPFITVAAIVDPLPRTATVFTVSVQCGPTMPRGIVEIDFDPASRRGAVIVWDESDTEHTLKTYPLTPHGLRLLVRGLMLWPLDLLDDMAREDELTRRGHVGG